MSAVGIPVLQGGEDVNAPDYFADDFSPPQITLETREANGIRLDYVEYIYRRHPNQPWLETVFTYMIHENGRLRIEHDRMHTGLFPLSTWERLFSEAGFRFQAHRFSLSHWPRDYIILSGVLKKRGRR